MGTFYVLLLLIRCILQPSHCNRALLGQSNQKKNSLLPAPQLSTTSTPETSGRPGPASPSSLTSLPPWCPLPCSQDFPKNSPSLGSQPFCSGTRLLPCPSPHSCLVNSFTWLQALGQRLLTHKVSWAQAGDLPAPFTHCTLPPPEAKRPVLSHQQTCQGLCRCQALAGTPSHSSSKQPLAASPWPPLPLHEGHCHPSVLLSPLHPWLPLP